MSKFPRRDSDRIPTQVDPLELSEETLRVYIEAMGRAAEGLGRAIQGLSPVSPVKADEMAQALLYLGRDLSWIHKRLIAAHDNPPDGTESEKEG